MGFLFGCLGHVPGVGLGGARGAQGVNFFFSNVVMWHIKLTGIMSRTECNQEFQNKVTPDKRPLLCRKFCVINKPFTENIVYFCLKDICLPEKMIYGMHIHLNFSS